MLSKIIDFLSPQIEVPEFIDVYGGLAEVFELPNEDGSVQKFPIRCGLSLDACLEQGKYGELIPDSSKKGLAFWEPLGNVAVNFMGKNIYQIAGSARFICWLNMQVLGHADQCTISAQAAIEMLKILRTTRNISSGVYTKSFVEYLPTSLPTKGKDIWSKYTFDNKRGYLMHPFDHFAIDVSFKGSICADPVTMGSNFDCTY